MTMPSSSPTRPPLLMVAVLFLAIAAFQVAATMIFPALPTISRELHAAPAAISLSQTLFFAIGGLAAASLPLSDRFGRRRVLATVIALGTIGSILVIVSNSLPLYNVGRWLQAPGVIALPLSFLILREHVSADRYPLYIGWLSALNLGATGVDGAVAGILTDTVGYRGIFWIAAIAGAVALIGVLVAIPVGALIRIGRTDWAGLATLGSGVVLFSVGLSLAGSLGWGSALTIGLLLGGLALLTMFIVIERRTRHPLVEVRHLRTRSVISAPLVILFGMAGFMAVFAFLAPFWAQLPTSAGGFGLSATTYALATIPGTVLSFVLAPICGGLARRVGWRPILVAGTVLAFLGLVGLAVCAQIAVPWFISFALVATVFSGASMTAANGLGVLLSPRESPAFLPGIISVMFSFGSSFGSAVVGTIVAIPSPANFAIAFATAAAMMLIACGFTLLVPRPRHAMAAATGTAPNAEAAA